MSLDSALEYYISMMALGFFIGFLWALLFSWPRV